VLLVNEHVLTDCDRCCCWNDAEVDADTNGDVDVVGGGGAAGGWYILDRPDTSSSSEIPTIPLDMFSAW